MIETIAYVLISIWFVLAIAIAVHDLRARRRRPPLVVDPETDSLIIQLDKDIDPEYLERLAVAVGEAVAKRKVIALGPDAHLVAVARRPRLKAAGGGKS